MHRSRYLSILLALTLAFVLPLTAFAGRIHITGGTTFASSNLRAAGKIAGLGGLGLHEVKVKLEGTYFCNGGGPETAEGLQMVTVSKGAVNFDVTTDDVDCHDVDDHLSWTDATITVFSGATPLASESYTCTTTHSGTTCKRN